MVCGRSMPSIDKGSYKNSKNRGGKEKRGGKRRLLKAFNLPQKMEKKEGRTIFLARPKKAGKLTR